MSIALPIFCSSKDIYFKLSSIDEKVVQEKCIQKYKEVEQLFREYSYIN